MRRWAVLERPALGALINSEALGFPRRRATGELPLGPSSKVRRRQRAPPTRGAVRNHASSPRSEWEGSV